MRSSPTKIKEGSGTTRILGEAEEGMGSTKTLLMSLTTKSTKIRAEFITILTQQVLLEEREVKR